MKSIMEFAKLAGVFEKVERTSGRLEITGDLAKLFGEVEKEAKKDKGEVKRVTYLAQGVLAPEHHGIQLGIGDKLAEQAISSASGRPVREIEELYRKKGDLGLVAEALMQNKMQHTLQSQLLTVRKVYENLYKIATSAGGGSQSLKVKLLSELLSNSTPEEAKVITRFATGTLRLGIGEPTILDSLSVLRKGDKTFRIELEKAFNFTSDLGLVAETYLLKGENAVREIKPTLFNPIRPALAERLPGAREIFEKLGECALESKYDGLRLQLHIGKEGGKRKVEIYSRKQERITHMFPDIIQACAKEFIPEEAILEGEAIAFNESTGQFLPFQATIQRKRKHGIEAKVKELPLKLFVFELLYLNGKDLTPLPYKERRELLAKQLREREMIQVAKSIIARKQEDIQEFFDECVDAGLEGVIAKDLKAPYIAGARKFAWIKLKKSYSGELSDTLDLTILGYYLGKGKRTEFGFGGMLCGVYAGKERKFKTIAKVGTGFSEEKMQEFAKELGKIEVREKPGNVSSLIEPDKWVTPRMVIEVRADEITKSPVHTCGMVKGEGFALRFPRMVKTREDKKAEDSTTEEEVLEMYEMQARKEKDIS